MLSPSLLLVLFLVAALAPSRAPALSAPRFRDVTAAARIDTSFGRAKKYGSPAVVDLDRDGHPDLLFCHHDTTFTELYFNNADGTFTKPHWGIYHDSHGFSAFPVSPWQKTMRFTLSVGGNWGRDPAHPLMFQVNPNDRSITQVTQQAAITAFGGRGRTAVYLDLSMGAHPYWPDAIYTNGLALSGPSQFAYENVGRLQFAPRNLSGDYHWSVNALATVTDVDNDGTMELIAYWDLKFYKITAPFTLTEITDTVLPPHLTGLARKGVLAVAEIDFDNDGDFDLYLARTRVGRWMPDIVYEDILLENRNGRYVDVSERARIPRGLASRGVSVGDFNNDGWMDLQVTQFEGDDVLLLNNGDGTFTAFNGLTSHAPSTRGDHAVAVDYDMDGNVDLVMSEGHQDDVNLGGTFKIFRNEMSNNGNYIHVRVGNPWDRSCTPLNAVVHVRAGDLRMWRRVGSPGDSVSHSYLETLHFGLGQRTVIDSIFVKYTNGYVVMRRNVSHGQTVVLGLL
ncbi:unnamed protein product [Agarophyton chilense]|eukprot:gb/GEZJ01002742.1/.p1 GENE.gb/GEZJ01002742.1/~~gb/GEZJ01002742.1/.p1  ORF type:complete len:509 (-),score=61.58 gb/GEZJ01002742.1/:217-1743(-)